MSTENTEILCLKFFNITYEYLDIMKNSTYFSKLENKTFLLSIGFRMLVHIFQMNYVHTKNIEDTYYNCQKAYYYYLEYLEQMYTTNMYQHLNYTDAILFVYSKTLVKYDLEYNLSDDTNINLSIDDNMGCKYITKITKLLNLIFWWENSNIDIFNIPKKIIENILMSCIKSRDFTLDELYFMIEKYQNKSIIYHQEYIDFLQNIF